MESPCILLFLLTKKSYGEPMKFLILVSIAALSFSISAAKIDLKKSTFEWTGTKITGKHNGTITAISGTVDMKGDKIIGGEVVLNMKTISTTDLSGKWKKKLDSHLKDGDFFQVKKYPKAMIKITKVYGRTMMADLTIKDQTHKVEFPYTKKGNMITGKMTFDRTKYGIKYNSSNFFEKLGDKAINNEVTVDYKLVVM